MSEYNGKPFQGIRETANTTGFSQFFLRNGVRNGNIPHIRCGEKILVNVPAFLALMDEQSKKSAEAGG